MYTVEILQDGNWIVASKHSTQADADIQITVFESRGMQARRGERQDS